MSVVRLEPVRARLGEDARRLPIYGPDSEVVTWVDLPAEDLDS